MWGHGTNMGIRYGKTYEAGEGGVAPVETVPAGETPSSGAPAASPSRGGDPNGAGRRLGIPWSALASSRRDPSGEDLVELRLVGWLAWDLVVPTPALDPVEDHREIASPQPRFHVD